MSLFSRRSMMIVAGGALTLPLAAGTASAAFDLRVGSAAPVDELAAPADPAADAGGVVSERGATVEGSIRVPGEQVAGSISASPDGGSFTADTPLGNGSTQLQTESFDVNVR
jgi:hypothetical protein